MEGAEVLTAALEMTDWLGAPRGIVRDQYRSLLGDLPESEPGTGATHQLAAVDRSEPPELRLGRLCEDRLDPGERRRRGSWYTPWPLARGLVGFAISELDPRTVPSGGPSVHDPAVGGGVFLLAAAEALLSRYHPDEVLALLTGTDVDPLAVFAARMTLWLWNRRRGGSAPPPEGIVIADGLVGDRSHDLTVGNPPFGGRLRDPTALPDTVPEAGAYTDLAVLFLLSSLRRTRRGGVVAMIQPNSVLSSRDTESVRCEAALRGRTVGIWEGTRVFSAQVDVCAPVIAVGPPADPDEQLRVGILGGPDAAEVGEVSLAAHPSGTLWSRAVNRSRGAPEPVIVSSGVALGDVATVTADFRDQYYGIVDLLNRGGGQEAGCQPPTGSGSADSVPVMTVGLIDPLRDLTEERTTRLGKVRRSRPRIGRRALSGSPLSRWATARLVPKVLVATQTRVLEALADPEGTILPCTPVVSVIPDTGARVGSSPLPRVDVWHLAALLVAPTATAWLAERAAGSGLSPGAFRVRCGQLRDLPLPRTGAEWDRAADLARRCQRASGGEESRRLLLRVGRAMCAAYGIGGTERSELMSWWEGRLPPVRG